MSIYRGAMEWESVNVETLCDLGVGLNVSFRLCDGRGGRLTGDRMESLTSAQWLWTSKQSHDLDVGKSSRGRPRRGEGSHDSSEERRGWGGVKGTEYGRLSGDISFRLAHFRRPTLNPLGLALCPPDAFCSSPAHVATPLHLFSFNVM